MNTSSKLDWNDTTAPLLTDYMMRMKEAEYSEKYRKIVLEKAFKNYDRMVKDEEEARRPMHRPKHWQKEERLKDKRRKKHTWATKGGCIAPIIIPPTPNSELLNMLRDVAKAEALPGLKFKIVESGGKTIKSSMQKSNPTSSGSCQGGDCVACRGGRESAGSCRKSNVVYEYRCQLCPPDSQAVYFGETARNLYTRGREHSRNYNKREEESFQFKHQKEKHHGVEPDFNAKIVYNFKECLSRQVAEGVCIRRCDSEILNNKSEWHQPSLWRVRSELSRE